MQNIITFLTGDFLTLYLPTIISLALIEVLLSIDNALVNASLAEPLPEKQRKLAIKIGILGGAGLRLVALFFATMIIQNKWILIIGGLYLVYLAVTHLFLKHDDAGHNLKYKTTFGAVIMQIIFADAVFSIDNVVSAVGLSHNYYVIVAGVMIGIVSMLFVTQLVSGIIHKHPPLKKAAYVIVGLIGIVLLFETALGTHISELIKFSVIMSVLATAYVFSHRNNKRKVKINKD
jgi:YkoY family integral membrane protein